MEDHFQIHSSGCWQASGPHWLLARDDSFLTYGPLQGTDNHKGVITHTHLELDILECKVRWALESITKNKLVQVMEFQLSCFKS